MSNELSRGRIYSQVHVEYDVWAECGRCGGLTDDLPSRGRPLPGDRTQVQELRRRGWRRTRDGWTCPDCLQAAHQGSTVPYRGSELIVTDDNHPIRSITETHTHG
jgi:hypothetical protein